MTFLAYFVWDPSPSIFSFNIPLLNRPILWYGFLFAFGFFAGYLVLTYLLRRYFRKELEFIPHSARNLDLDPRKSSRGWTIANGSILRIWTRLRSFNRGALARSKSQVSSRVGYSQASSRQIKEVARKIAEQITFYVIIGAVVGARLGDLLFYQNYKEILKHPLSVIAVWGRGALLPRGNDWHPDCDLAFCQKV